MTKQDKTGKRITVTAKDISDLSFVSGALQALSVSEPLERDLQNLIDELTNRAEAVHLRLEHRYEEKMEAA